jgi:hypothetical protein
MGEVKAKGLKWIKRSKGKVPVWVADEKDVKNGFLPRTVNLSDFIDQPDILVAKCNALQSNMVLFRTGYKADPLEFDGTVKALFSVYQRHPESIFRSLKPATRKTYCGFIPKIESHIGNRQVSAINGLDIKKYHRVWSRSGKNLATATTCLAIFESALRFGVMCRFEGCPELLTIVRESKRGLGRPKPRTSVVTASQVTSARKAAHAAGRPSSALAYALVFETTLRLWDVIGQWWPMEEGALSDVLDTNRRAKWFGLRWEDIDENMMLTYTPSKTAETTGKSVFYPLSNAPMVLEEIANIPMDKRKGPMIVDETSGIPYYPKNFAYRWRLDRKAANIPSTVWARDLRASGISEAMANDASIDDASKVAGHSGTATTSKVYNRAVLEAADRFSAARLKGRKHSGNGSGNER